MPAGQIWPITIVSGPAPEGRWNGFWPSATSAGVTREALHGRGEARGAVDRDDGSEREALGLQHRSLFNVQFDEGRDAACAQCEETVRIAAELRQRLPERDSVGVPLAERIGGH